MCAVVTVIIKSVKFSESVIINVLKSVAKKCLMKTEEICVCCGYSVIWRVWFSEAVTITVLKSVTRKCLVNTEDFLCVMWL
jgi:hypothetical protein